MRAMPALVNRNKASFRNLGVKMHNSGGSMKIMEEGPDFLNMKYNLAKT